MANTCSKKSKNFLFKVQVLRNGFKMKQFTFLFLLLGVFPYMSRGDSIPLEIRNNLINDNNDSDKSSNNLDLTESTAPLLSPDLIELLFPPTLLRGPALGKEDTEYTEKMRIQLAKKLADLLEGTDPSKVDLHQVAHRLAKLYVKQLDHSPIEISDPISSESSGSDEIEILFQEPKTEIIPPSKMNNFPGFHPQNRHRRGIGNDPFLLFFLTEEKIKSILAKRHLSRKRHVKQPRIKKPHEPHD